MTLERIRGVPKFVKGLAEFYTKAKQAKLRVPEQWESWRNRIVPLPANFRPEITRLKEQVETVDVQIAEIVRGAGALLDQIKAGTGQCEDVMSEIDVLLKPVLAARQDRAENNLREGRPSNEPNRNSDQTMKTNCKALFDDISELERVSRDDREVIGGMRGKLKALIAKIQELKSVLLDLERYAADESVVWRGRDR